MKKILQIIIFLISIVTFSQEELIGEYCTIPIGESDVTCINFKENNRFEYTVSGCLGVSDIGTGKFELNKDNLKLIFDKKEQLIKSKIKIEEIESALEKEVIFKFNISDENNLPLYVNIVKKPENIAFKIFKENKIISQTKNDSIGNYQILSLGYEIIELELDNLTDKKIEITMFPIQPKVISDTTLTLNLSEISEKEFKAGTNFWNTYRKVKK
jgi:hypothetical protein